MGNKQYLIDTNIIIYFLDKKIPDMYQERVATIFRSSFNISTITKIEVLGWHKIPSAEKQKLNRFMANAEVFYVDEAVEAKSISLKQSQKMTSPDAIIAATATLHDLILLTRNVKDFKKVPGLKIFNPFEMFDIH